MVSWKTLCEAGGFVIRHACKIAEGSAFAIAETKFSDSECVDLVAKVKGMEQCLPWTDHLTETAIKESGRMIAKKDWRGARWAIILGKEKDANPWCIDLLLNAAIMLIEKCPTVIYDASPWVHVINIKKLVPK